MSDDDQPLIPVRMLNEFAYCPRLFHLEWVQGEFADNLETVHGRSVHRGVDRGGRALPPPAGIDEGLSARSVDLDAPSLGLVAKIDLVEADRGSVVPVERKRGRPRADGGVWEPEEIQVVAQALILRAAGYRVDRGVVSFPEARHRVDIPITAEREARVHEFVAQARRTAAGPCPPPLVDSPKCPRCALVGICLPDETRSLRHPDAEPPRRLLTPADDAQPLYVQEQGARIGKRGDRVIVTKDGEEIAGIRSIDVSHVSVYGNVGMSAQVLRAFCERGVPITHHTYGGWLVGVTTGVGHKNALLRVEQFAVAADCARSLRIARRIVAGKIRNQRTMLRRNGRGDSADELRQMKRLEHRLEAALGPGELLGIEGMAARLYFGGFRRMLAENADVPAPSFVGRNRRPPRDPVNALLSFAYSMLVRECVVACLRVGFDPYVGLYHRPRYGRPALALDLAEEFRPLVADSVVIAFVNNGQIRPSTFVVRAGAWALTQKGRRDLIAAFERRLAQEIRHPVFGYRLSYRRVAELQARLLARTILGELEDYTPFVTR